MLKLYRALAIVVVVVVTALILYFQWLNKLYTTYTVQSQYTYERSAENSTVLLGTGIVVYSKDGMSFLDNRGTAIWNQTYEMQSPIVRTCDNVVAIGDYNGRHIYVGNTSQILGSIETTLPIRDFTVSANGVVAAVLDDSTVTPIYLYDSSGTQLAFFKTTMSKSGYPMAVAISDDATLVAISYLKAEQGNVSTTVGFYNFSAVGQNYTDNLVAGYGYSDSVVPYLKFLNGNKVVAVADGRLMFYEGSEIPTSTQDIILADEAKSVYANDDHIGLVYYNTQGDDVYRLETYDTAGNKVQEISFSLEYKDILYSRYGTIIYNDNECIIYDWSGRLKFEGTFKEGIDLIIPSESSIENYTLVTADKIQNIALKEGTD